MCAHGRLIARATWRSRSPSDGGSRSQLAHDHDHGAEQNTAFAAIHQSTYRLYGRYRRGFAALESGRPMTFADRPTSSVVVGFIDESVRGTSWPVRLESHMLRWEHSWLTVNFLDLPTAGRRAPGTTSGRSSSRSPSIRVPTIQRRSRDRIGSRLDDVDADRCPPAGPCCQNWQ